MLFAKKNNMVFEKRLIPLFHEQSSGRRGIGFYFAKNRLNSGQIKEKGDFYEYTITSQKS